HRRGAKNAEETRRRARERKGKRVGTTAPSSGLVHALRRVSAPPLRSLRLCGEMVLRSAPLAFLAIAFFAIAAKAETMTVAPSPARFQSLQEAIAAAKPGDVIRVQPGVYTGQFILDKQLKLEGVGKPVLRGDGRGSVVIVIADHCSIR